MLVGMNLSDTNYKFMDLRMDFQILWTKVTNYKFMNPKMQFRSRWTLISWWTSYAFYSKEIMARDQIIVKKKLFAHLVRWLD